MQIFLLVTVIVLLGMVLLDGFLLLGTLRTLSILRWRLDQLEATQPRRIGRSGLRPGKKAPDFTLPDCTGQDVSLHTYAGTNVLLLFMQSSCKPCLRILRDLPQILGRERVKVLVVNSGDSVRLLEALDGTPHGFQILTQKRWQVSRLYEAFATPFAFLIDERGIVRARGIIKDPGQVRFVLANQSVGSGMESTGRENE